MSKAFLRNLLAGLSTVSAEGTLIFDGRLLSPQENAATSRDDETMRDAGRNAEVPPRDKKEK